VNLHLLVLRRSVELLSYPVPSSPKLTREKTEATYTRIASPRKTYLNYEIRPSFWSCLGGIEARRIPQGRIRPRRHRFVRSDPPTFRHLLRNASCARSQRGIFSREACSSVLCTRKSSASRTRIGTMLHLKYGPVTRAEGADTKAYLP
jgi:hypothetical protein